MKCEQCNKDFEKNKKEGLFVVRKYCSTKCSSLARRSIPVERICRVCSNVFLIGGHHNKRGIFYCSVDCRGRGRNKHGEVPNVMSPTEASYLAGLIDGEGSVVMYKKKSCSMRLSVANTYEPVMKWMMSVVGIGAIIQQKIRKENKVCYLWQLNSVGVSAVLKQVLPYLIIKNQQARIVIAAQESLNDPMKKADQEWQINAVAQLKELNKRGRCEKISSISTA